MSGKIVVSIDYGKNLGVAMYDGNVMKPVGVFNRNGLLTFLSNFKFDILVVGIPYNLKGKFSKKTFEVVRFAVKLKRRIKSKKVFLYDERFTTVYGKKVSGMNEKKYRKFKDVIAAMNILDGFLKSPQLSCEIDDDRFIKLDEKMIDRMKGKKIVVERVLLDPRDERLKSLNITFLVCKIRYPQMGSNIKLINLRFY